jgi:large subunit ribosomal protein L24
MKQAFSTKWKSSKRPAKQRKYRYNAPLHISQKFLSAHLSKDLIKRYRTRSVQIVSGDKVKVVRGQFKGRENKVEKADHKNTRVYITGIERAKKDGSKSMIPINPTNLIITELNLDDKNRKAAMEKGAKKVAGKESGKESKKEPAKQTESQEEKQNA